MAQKKATVFILNVTNSMSKEFSTSLSVMTEFIEDKVMAGRKTDMVAVLLAGTPESHNILNDTTPEQYQGVTSMGPISQPNVDLLKRIQNLSTSSEDTSPADVFDSVIVASQMIREHCRNLKYEKRIILITNNHNKIDWLDLDDVAGMLKDLNAQLTIIGTDYSRLSDPDCPEDIALNYKNWQIFIDKADTAGEILSLQTAYEITQEDSAKEVRPTPSFRGYLYIGDPHENNHVVGISIHMFIRTKTVPLPRGHKYSAHSEGPTHKVEPDALYKFDTTANAETSLTADEIDETVVEDKTRLEQAFRFGKTAILISRDEVVSNNFSSRKEMTVIGFIDKNQFKRHYIYSNAYILTAGSYNVAQSSLALSAFAKALYDEQSYAVVRYVQKDDGQPRIGLLLPEDREGEEDVEYLLQYYDLPFAEDIRDYKFKSVADPKASDPKSINLMDSLIDSMELDNTKKGRDYLAPEYLYNPILWRFNKAIKNRALNPDAPIPDIKESARCQFEIYPDFKDKASEYCDLLASTLEVCKVIDKGKGKRRMKGMGDTADPANAADISELLGNSKSSQEGPIYAPLTPSEKAFRAAADDNHEVETVGMITPVEDFLAILRKKSEVDQVEIAIRGMVAAIHKFLAMSFGNQNYPIVISCLKAFRENAAKEDAAASYNKHVREIKQWCNMPNKSSTRQELWKSLKTENLGLITNEECDDTDNLDTTREVAEKFWNVGEDDQDADDMMDLTEDGNDNKDENVAFDADELDDLL
ncbi:SPOC like C-terminal domain-containing protein [Parasitella parasitica]|nr:SPOC like C-terminal domain-containing protein [Parasitella parasitica]